MPTTASPAFWQRSRRTPPSSPASRRGFGWDFDQVRRARSRPLARSTSTSTNGSYDLLECVERTNARRVVIDSLGDLLFASPDEIRFREMMYSLSQRLARRGVSLMMTHESAELFRVTRLSEIGMSHLADNVVVLQYLRAESEVKRALLVLKTRASDHHPEIREFRIPPKASFSADRSTRTDNSADRAEPGGRPDGSGIDGFSVKGSRLLERIDVIARERRVVEAPFGKMRPGRCADRGRAHRHVRERRAPSMSRASARSATPARGTKTRLETRSGRRPGVDRTRPRRCW